MPVMVMAEPSPEKKPENNISIPEGAIVNATHVSRFSPEEVFSLFLTSRRFREAVMSGKYIFTGDHIVINSARCVSVFKDSLRVRPGALSHPGDFLLRKKVVTVEDPADHSKKVYELIEQASKIDSVRKIDKESVELVIGYGCGDDNNDPHRSALNIAMRQEMRRQNVTEEWVAEEAGISVKTIQRMRNDPEYRPSLQTVVAVCLGMHLFPYNSNHLLYVAGYILNDLTIERIYQALLNITFKTPMKEINDALVRLGYTPFVDKE